MKHLTRSVFTRFWAAAIVLSALALAGATIASAQQYSQKLYQGMRWRTIGPLRAGRTRAASGVPSEPNVFYIGAVNGGVWKSDDYGRTWHPIFNHEPTGSIGAIAVAPSDPNVIYVGSGEGLHRPDLAVGDGMYKSTDAGKTWVHLGLRETQQIPNVAVDPRNPNVVFVAALGHPYGPNPERGIFRSTDGGKTFQKVLYIDEYTGGSDVEIDPQNPQIVYAAMWQAQEAPWENGAWGGTEGGLFKSTDGGNTWHKIGDGFPKGVIQVDVAIAASEPSRLYATVAYGQHVGIFRSDDAGAHWYSATTDPRPKGRIGGGDLPVPKVDPKNPDVVYSCSVVTWRSTDGGKTWTGIRAAPGGDDSQNMGTNPNNPDNLPLPTHQGAIASSTAANAPASIASPGRLPKSRRCRCAATVTAPCAPSRSFSPRPIRTSFISPPTRCGKRATEAKAGNRSAPTSRAPRGPCPASPANTPPKRRSRAAASSTPSRPRRSTSTPFGPAPTTASSGSPPTAASIGKT